MTARNVQSSQTLYVVILVNDGSNNDVASNYDVGSNDDVGSCGSSDNDGNGGIRTAVVV